jgi:lipoprotein-anchoring transpeptidase ErfK/SrfK
VFRAPVGVGKRGTPTPGGRFWIRERLRLRGHGGMYGPLAFGTAAYSVLSEWPKGGVVGIHGTDEPQLIPGRPSHGCIRMRNKDIRRLGRILPIGTPLQIL